MGSFLEHNYNLASELKDSCIKEEIKNPKVSIIVPVYNVEKYIKQALDSIINQTLQDIEIICINDCTTDKSFEIVKEYARKDNRFVLLEQATNQGQGVARNWGIDIAKGEYIMFLDPDDWYELTACEEACKQITKNKNDMVLFGHFRYLDKNKTKKNNLGMLKPYADYINEPKIKLKDFRKSFFRSALTVMYIYKKDFLNRNNIRYAQGRVGEDLEYAINTLACCESMSIINKPLYNYRKRNDSASQNPQDWENLYETRKKCYEIVSQYNNNKAWFKKHYITYFINNLLYWFKDFSRKDSKICKNFYHKMREIFIELNQNHDISEIKTLLGWKNYTCFNLCVENENLFSYKIKREFKKLYRALFGGIF